MPLEKRLVDGHVFDGYQALRAFEFDNPVDQQERVTVGKKTQDFLDVEDHSLAPGNITLVRIINNAPALAGGGVALPAPLA
jgi:hypothetical protein